MTAVYPDLPFTPVGVPPHARGAWWTATQLVDWLVDWSDGDTLRTYPPELTTGHAALCTARYDSEGICHEHAECALVDPEPPVPPCTCRPARRRLDHGGPWGLVVFRSSSSRYRINPLCWHHGDGSRW